jgi:hypothetical protein
MNNFICINNAFGVNPVDDEKLIAMLTTYIQMINTIGTPTYIHNEIPRCEENVNIRCQICYDPTCVEDPCPRSDSAK